MARLPKVSRTSMEKYYSGTVAVYKTTCKIKGYRLCKTSGLGVEAPTRQIFLTYAGTYEKLAQFPVPFLFFLHTLIE